jgi:hypothetical protein
MWFKDWSSMISSERRALFPATSAQARRPAPHDHPFTEPPTLQPGAEGKIIRWEKTLK